MTDGDYDDFNGGSPVPVLVGVGDSGLSYTRGSGAIDSEDGKKWTQAGETAHCYQQVPEASLDSWLLYSFRVSLKEPVSGRYVKAAIENSGYIWISEIAVYTYDDR